MAMNKKLIHSVLAGVVAIGLSSAATSAMADGGKAEKCSGVAKAQKNDCGTAKHSCAGQSATDGAAEDWVYLPKGVCDKIVGGVVLKAQE